MVVVIVVKAGDVGGFGSAGVSVNGPHRSKSKS